MLMMPDGPGMHKPAPGQLKDVDHKPSGSIVLVSPAALLLLTISQEGCSMKAYDYFCFKWNSCKKPVHILKL